MNSPPATNLPNHSGITWFISYGSGFIGGVLLILSLGLAQLHLYIEDLGYLTVALFVVVWILLVALNASEPASVSGWQLTAHRIVAVFNALYILMGAIGAAYVAAVLDTSLWPDTPRSWLSRRYEVTGWLLVVAILGLFSALLFLFRLSSIPFQLGRSVDVWISRHYSRRTVLVTFAAFTLLVASAFGGLTLFTALREQQVISQLQAEEQVLEQDRELMKKAAITGVLGAQHVVSDYTKGLDEISTRRCSEKFRTKFEDYRAACLEIEVLMMENGDVMAVITNFIKNGKSLRDLFFVEIPEKTEGVFRAKKALHDELDETRKLLDYWQGARKEMQSFWGFR